MSLEAIEQRCFLVLSEAENPLVSLDVLLAHIRQDPECVDINADELLAFIRNHALFDVFEPSTASGAGQTEDPLAVMGLSPTPRVILKTRIPTPSDLAEQMFEELNVLAAALGRALEEFEQKGPTAQSEQTRALLDRVQALQEKLRGPAAKE
ncbi:MAG: hypothetical protein HZB26_09475 [Candidatus Hydrogenedentes bacterium]|nr:hypothetical protein [Candidatus Hydrogenedentota bacterium]